MLTHLLQFDTRDCEDIAYVYDFLLELHFSLVFTCRPDEPEISRAREHIHRTCHLILNKQPRLVGIARWELPCLRRDEACVGFPAADRNRQGKQTIQHSNAATLDILRPRCRFRALSLNFCITHREFAGPAERSLPARICVVASAIRAILA